MTSSYDEGLEFRFHCPSCDSTDQSMWVTPREPVGFVITSCCGVLALNSRQKFKCMSCGKITPLGEWVQKAYEGV